MIVYAWVNDEATLRKAGSSSDPYAVFRAMLVAGNPPHDWNRLLDACGMTRNAPEGEAIERVLGPLTPVATENDEAPTPPRKPCRRR